MYVWFDALINYMSGFVPSSDENLHRLQNQIDGVHQHWCYGVCAGFMLEMCDMLCLVLIHDPANGAPCRTALMLQTLSADFGQPTCTSWARRINDSLHLNAHVDGKHTLQPLQQVKVSERMVKTRLLLSSRLWPCGLSRVGSFHAE